MTSNQALEGLDEIEKALAAIRNSLADESLSDTVRQFVDWRPHFGAHPWLCCGAAAALGALVVPRRRQSPCGGSAESADAAGSTASLAATVKGLAAEALVGESLMYLMHEGREILARSGSNGRTPSEGEPTPHQTAEKHASAAENGVASQPVPSQPELSAFNIQLKGMLNGLHRECVRHPEKSLAIALAAGVLLGWVAKRR